MTFKHDLLTFLTCTIGGSISDIEGDRVYQSFNSKGDIVIKSAHLGSNILFLKFDFELKEPLQLDFPAHNTPSLFFIYCMEGMIHYTKTGNKKDLRQIIKLQTAIVGNDTGIVQMRIPEEQVVSLALIQVIEDNSEISDFQKEPEYFMLKKELFKHFTRDTPIAQIDYQSSLNLGIKEQLVNIEAISHRGVVRKLLIKGIVHTVLALEIIHYEEDKFNQDVLTSNLTTSEMLRVQEALTQISDQPEYDYSIDYLCEKYGLPARKLQEGFKLLSDMTVALYVQEQRLYLAEKLIKQGDMTISEIVYSIGFSSRSYFSKIFKKKFKCSPRYYSDKCQNLNLPYTLQK